MNLNCFSCPVRPRAVPFLCAMVQPQEGRKGEAIVGPDYSTPVPDVVFGGARPLASPKEPTEAEIERHMLTHLPYCPWCKYCVAGRRPNSHHRRQRNERTVPMLSLDYGFFRDPNGPLITFLVLTLKPYGIFFAIVVDTKGISHDVC